jgi:hypothetical protein
MAAATIPPMTERLGCHAFVGRLLIKPATFLDHLEGSVRLLRLVVVIELPRQIADEKQKKAKGSNGPNGALVVEQVACHVESSRVETSLIVRSRDSSTALRSARKDTHMVSLAPENSAHRRAIATGDF